MPDRDGGVTEEAVPLRNAMNEVTRAAYINDCDIGVQRWNRLIAEAGYEFRLALPSPRFRRAVGVWAGAVSTRRAIRSARRRWAARRRRMAADRGGPRLCQEP